jgi:hypothetical protein
MRRVRYVVAMSLDGHLLLLFGYLPHSQLHSRGHVLRTLLVKPQGSCQRGSPGRRNAQIVVGYLTLQPFGLGSKITSPSAGVFVGAMNVT